MKPKWRLLRALLVLSCAFAMLIFHSTPAAAKSGAALEVRSASGKAGDSVGIAVSLRGLKNLSGVEGLSGGEFEVHYDPAMASIAKISRGSAVGSSFMFMPNKKFSESSAKVTLIAASALICKDGDLCNVTFKLKKKGTVEVTLEELAFYDQDVRVLTVGSTTALPPVSPPGKGSADGNKPDQDETASGTGLAVELLSPAKTAIAPRESAAKKGEADGVADHGQDAGTAVKEEPAGSDTAADPGADGAAEDNSPGKHPPWLRAAICFLAIALVAAAVYYAYRHRFKAKYHIVLAIMVVLSAALLLYFSGCPFGKMRGGAAIDSNLEAALREHLGKRWGALSVEDWAGLKKVEFPGRSIERLAGFEHAVNLRELNLRNNEIEDPAPLGELPRLKYLNLADNKIKDISGLNGAVLNGLAHLDVSINRIDDLSALDWDELKALTHLDIRYNYIDLQDRAVAELLSDLRSRGVNVLSEPMY